jgi:fermentation-respiration switch protein FrsA (DUF1100 family)
MIKWLLILVLGYGGIVALVYFGQRALQYFPEKFHTAPAAVGLRQAEETAVGTSDGERVIIWHIPPQQQKPVVLYFHGNGGSLAWRVERFRALTATGFGLVALSYRGYGGSSGRPTQTGLVADAVAAYAFTAERYPTRRIALWGESIGSGVAVAVAAAKPVLAVVLESAFTSAADVGAAVYWYLPVRLLMKDQFRSDLVIEKVTAPVLMLHGDRDAVVPIMLGEHLYSLIKARKRFLRFPGAGHNDLGTHGAVAEAIRFLEEEVGRE